MNKSKLEHEFAPSGFFALRTPLLPFDEILAFSDDLEAISAADDPARLEAAVAQDRCRLRRRLRALFARPEVREALFVASPSLDQRLDDWLAGKGVRTHLCKAPCGPFRQMSPDPFS